MKLELYGLIESILEAGGKFDYDRYVLLNRNGRPHRKDGPAVIYLDGGQEWYRDGQLHRDDGPAVIYPNGEQNWYRHGLYHRDDGPAVIYPDGRLYWFIDGRRVYFTHPTPA